MAVSLEHESRLWDAGAAVVAGVDEVGRGALAGPVSVGVCAVARCASWPDGLADSKRLTARRREALVLALSGRGPDGGAAAGFGVARAVGHASADEVDGAGIIGALRLAASRALDAVAAQGVGVDAILLDGRHDWLTAPDPVLFGGDAPPGVTVPVQTVVRGDDLCASVAAASVLAKVERDALMRAAHAEHPEYGWESNVGYGAEAHLEALRRLGPTPWHRTSWRLPGMT